MIQIDLSSSVPIYLQIANQVRLGVASGVLPPGTRLEPVRDLARRLAVNASTVARAYQLLEHDGVIQTNRRGGSLIAWNQDAEALRALREDRLRGILERAIVEALAHGHSPPEVQATFDLQLAVWRERRQPAALPARQLASDVTALRFAGSHDLALEALWAQARQLQPELALTASYVGSLDGLLALLHGDAIMAGAHILDEETGEYNVPILRRLFMGQSLTLLTLAERQQGFIVPRGNPHGIKTLADLARPGIRFINRQQGSGTRTLLDHHLRRKRIMAESIIGYDVVAPTHVAVASAVAEGQADVALGLVAAARAYGLGFVPLARERYDLILRTENGQCPQVKLVLDIIAKPDFRAVVAELGGYDTTHTGEERSIA
jgi:molybdate-binding protein/DNA-binding transcriptional regulator YhcF (GntR family)